MLKIMTRKRRCSEGDNMKQKELECLHRAWGEWLYTFRNQEGREPSQSEIAVQAKIMQKTNYVRKCKECGGPCKWDYCQGCIDAEMHLQEFEEISAQDFFDSERG